MRKLRSSPDRDEAKSLTPKGVSFLLCTLLLKMAQMQHGCGVGGWGGLQSGKTSETGEN